MLRSVIAASALFSSAAGGLEASQPLPQPAGKWIVNFAENRCVASRAYIAGVQEWVIGIEPRPASTEVRVLVVVPGEAPRLENARIAAGGEPISTAGMALKGTDARKRLHYAVRLFAPEYARLEATGKLRVDRPGTSLEFELQGLPAVQRQLDLCLEDLLAGWGLSREQQAQLASFPVPEQEPGRYLYSDDYPSSAFHRGASGETMVRLLIGTDGKPRQCVVEQSSGHADLDSTTCSILMKRSRYKPARDQAGNPVESPFIAMVVWNLG